MASNKEDILKRIRESFEERQAMTPEQIEAGNRRMEEQLRQQREELEAKAQARLDAQAEKERQRKFDRDREDAVMEDSLRDIQHANWERQQRDIAKKDALVALKTFAEEERAARITGEEESKRRHRQTMIAAWLAAGTGVAGLIVGVIALFS